MKRLVLVGGVFALALIGLFYSGIRIADIWRAITLAGWGILIVIAVRYLLTMMLAYASWVIMPRDQRPHLWQSSGIRFVRDAVNTLLPTTQVGGDIVATRLITLCGSTGPMAAAAMVIDLFLQVATQFVFALGGTVVLLQLGADPSIIRAVITGLLIAAPLLVGFYFIQRLGFGSLLVSVLRKIAGGKEWAAFAATDAFYDALAQLRTRRRALILGTTLHLAAWLTGAAEVYAAFAFMGHDITIAEAFVVESIGQAVRGAAFAVPGAIGVQEGALVLLCGGFGIPAGSAVALSLIKRIADLAVGIPGFIFWYRLEGRRRTAAAPNRRTDRR